MAKILKEMNPQKTFQLAKKHYKDAGPIAGVYQIYKYNAYETYLNCKKAATEAVISLLSEKGIQTPKVKDYTKLDRKDEIKEICDRLRSLEKKDMKIMERKILKQYFGILDNFDCIKDLDSFLLDYIIKDTEKLINSINGLITNEKNKMP